MDLDDNGSAFGYLFNHVIYVIIHRFAIRNVFLLSIHAVWLCHGVYYTKVFNKKNNKGC